MQYTRLIPDEAAMLNLGAQLAKHAEKNFVLYLQGHLGAGKTTLVRGFLKSLGYKGSVKSPTYTLIEPYCVKGFDIYHVDLYRLEGEQEFYHIGLSDYLNSASICLIEWPEKVKKQLPTPTLHCDIQINGTEREVTLTAYGHSGEKILKNLSK